MARWQCMVCGLIYDEREGLPEDGIAPGTRWEDVPADWTCPDCGVSKDDFQLVAGSEDDPMPAATEQARSSQTEDNLPQTAGESIEASEGSKATDASDRGPAILGLTHKLPTGTRHVVIIGSGLAGYGVAREIRRRDRTLPITVVTADGGEFYSKPLISSCFTEQTQADRLATQTSEQFSAQLSISVLTRTRVIGIDTSAKRVALQGGTDLAYSELVLAMGADVVRPPMAGNAVDAVLSINDLDDYRRFRAAVVEGGARKVAIIGAGLIGCEFANDLLNGGFEIDSIDPNDWCLSSLLPEACGQALRQALEDKGVRFHFGARAAAVNHSDTGFTLTLSNGEEIHTNLVLSAVGVKPRTSLAEVAGIATARGVKTDRLLRTSAQGVYALGDCAEVEGQVLAYVAPLTAAAAALGATLTGNATEVAYPAMPVIVKTPACPVTACPPARGATGQWRVDGTGNDLKAVFESKDGTLLGYALTGAAVKEKASLTNRLRPLLP